jgi:hypothetical protein
MANERTDRDRRREAQRVSGELPAGLEDTGRDPNLLHTPEAQPSGARADHRHSVPGTKIPGAPNPASAAGEWERIRSAIGDSSEDRDQPSGPGGRAARRGGRGTPPP